MDKIRCGPALELAQEIEPDSKDKRVSYLVCEIYNKEAAQWQYGVVPEEDRPAGATIMHGPCSEDDAWWFLLWLGAPGREAARDAEQPQP